VISKEEIADRDAMIGDARRHAQQLSRGRKYLKKGRNFHSRGAHHKRGTWTRGEGSLWPNKKGFDAKNARRRDKEVEGYQKN